MDLNLSEFKKDDMLQYEYARSALGIGMQLEQKLGTNPYKVGFIGSTDSHTGLATAQDALNRLPAQVGYSKGVPMGGDLSKAP